MMVNNNDWLLVSTPLNHISQWEGLSHILWKINMFETTNQHCSIHMKWGLQPWDLAALPILFRSNPAPPTSGYERWTMMRPENTPGSFQLREQQRKLSFCWWVYTVYIYTYIYIIYLQIYIYIYMFIPHYVFD